jgi:hypothetical protein
MTTGIAALTAGETVIAANEQRHSLSGKVH